MGFLGGSGALSSPQFVPWLVPWSRRPDAARTPRRPRRPPAGSARSGADVSRRAARAGAARARRVREVPVAHRLMALRALAQLRGPYSPRWERYAIEDSRRPRQERTEPRDAP